MLGNGDIEKEEAAAKAAATEAEEVNVQKKGDSVSIRSSKEGSQMYVIRNAPKNDYIHFKFEMQFGEEADSPFECYLDAYDPENQSEGATVLIESSKLRDPDENTLKILKHAKIVITDKEYDMKEMMTALKSEIRKEGTDWRSCALTRFIILKEDGDMAKL